MTLGVAGTVSSSSFDLCDLCHLVVVTSRCSWRTQGRPENKELLQDTRVIVKVGNQDGAADPGVHTQPAYAALDTLLTVCFGFREGLCVFSFPWQREDIKNRIPLLSS